MTFQDVSCDNVACINKYQSNNGMIGNVHGVNASVVDKPSPIVEDPLCRTKKERAVITWVVALIAYDCPIATIVAVFGLDARTVRTWADRTGDHTQVFHHQQMRPLALMQVQIDELRLKIQTQVLWVVRISCFLLRTYAIAGSKEYARSQIELDTLFVALPLTI